MFKSERPTIPQWERHDLDAAERKEGEPIWQDVAVGQIDAKGETHLEYGFVGQDSYQVIESYEGRDDSLWCGVYDGHYFPTEYAEKKDNTPDKLAVATLPAYFNEALGAGKTYKEAFTEAFRRADQEIDKYGYGGATATVLLVEGKKFWVANVGDTHAFRFGENIPAERLTADHNVKNSKEAKQEAIERGGVYAKGYIRRPGAVGRELARSLGDKDMGEVVSWMPEVNEFEISDADEWLVIASDGLWDELDVHKVEKILKDYHEAEAAQAALLAAAGEVRGGNSDDVTVVVIKLKK